MLIYTRHFSTLIVGLFRGSLQSMRSAASLDCPRCGSKVAGLNADGTYVFTFESPSSPPNWSRFKHVAALTVDGKLSISCESLPSADAKI